MSRANTSRVKRSDTPRSSSTRASRRVEKLAAKSETRDASSIARNEVIGSTRFATIAANLLREQQEREQLFADLTQLQREGLDDD